MNTARSCCVLASLILFGLVDEACALPLISNGSFETPSAGSTFTSFVSGSSGLTGWNVTGPAGKHVSIVNGTFSQNGVAFPAQNGNQWLDLTGFNDNSTEGVSQSVATKAGDSYQLSFYVGNTFGDTIFGTTSTVNVFINGNALFTAVNSEPDLRSLTWEQFTRTFTASGGTTTIGFVNGDPATDNSNGLDNIVLTDLGPGTRAVPEPSSLLLLGAGLVGLGVLRRRRKASSANR